MKTADSLADEVKAALGPNPDPSDLAALQYRLLDLVDTLRGSRLETEFELTVELRTRCVRVTVMPSTDVDGALGVAIEAQPSKDSLRRRVQEPSQALIASAEAFLDLDFLHQIIGEAPLSQIQRRRVQFMLMGMSIRKIADTEGVSVAAIRNTLSSVLRTLQIDIGSSDDAASSDLPDWASSGSDPYVTFGSSRASNKVADRTDTPGAAAAFLNVYRDGSLGEELDRAANDSDLRI